MDHALELTAWADNDSDAERATMMRLAAAELRALRAERNRAQQACEQIAKRLRHTFDRWNNPPSPELPDGAGVLLEAAEIMETRMKTTPEEQAAMNYFNNLAATRKVQTMLPVSEFLRSWANEKQPIGVYAKGCDVLENAADYTPEQIVHRIVLLTVQAWAERNEPSGNPG